MGYSIKVLSSEDFDELPYGRAMSALGLCDPQTGEVYVRQTGLQDLTKYLLNHELDHLVEEVPTDEVDGIRYKDPGKYIGPISQVALPLIGNAIAPGIGGVLGGAAGGALNTGLSKGRKAKGIDYLTSAGIGAGTSYLGGKLTGNFGVPNQQIFSKSAIPNSGFSGITSAGKGVAVNSAQKSPGFMNNLLGMFSSGLGVKNIGSGISNAFGGGSGGGVGGGGGNGGGGDSGGSSFGKYLKDPAHIIGLGSLAVGLRNNNPPVHHLPQSAEDYRSKVKSGGNPLNQMAQNRLTEGLN